MNEAFLVCNTTREERERIVMEALSGGDDCDDRVSDSDYKFYEPYIEGQMELNECTRRFRGSYVRGMMDKPDRGNCGFGGF